MAISHWLILLLINQYGQPNYAEVVIENNGYQGLVVAIHEDVEENSFLLDSIKEMIIQASPMLYKSTKQRAFFEKATIVVPSTWSINPEYKLVPKHDYSSSAEVLVAPPHPNYGDIPYTLQLGGCGERGQFIHVTPEFLLESPSKNNMPKNMMNSRIFLHLWAHLRYGVFNEYGERGNTNYPMFYRDEFNKIRPNSCTSKIKGLIRRSDGKSPCILDINENLIEDCTFYPDLRTGIINGTGKASLMYMPELDSADEFCDDENDNTRHNPSAPNIHNLMCNTRSVLDVVLNNEDFKDKRNLPRNITNFTTEINVVQVGMAKSSSKFALVLDVSGSMDGQPLKHLQEATLRLIQYHIKDECNVTLGMVSFSTTARILANMTLVNNSSRAKLIAKIPKTTESSTGIGSGILKAIEMLRQDGDSIVKANIILLSDGEENSKPYINDVMTQIKQSGVTIYTLAFGNQASKRLEELSQMTGGKAVFYDPINVDKSLDSILNSMIIEGGCNELSIINTNRGIVVTNMTSNDGIFDVDHVVGSTLVVFISYSYEQKKLFNGANIVVNISDPSGKIFSCNNDIIVCTMDTNSRSVQFKISNATPGKWKYHISNPSNVDAHVNVMITSDTKEETKTNLIRIKSWLSQVNFSSNEVPKIYAKVSRDNVAVIRASVVATVHRPIGTEVNILLNDNGKGADMYAHDGVYTEYFTLYSGAGRYSIDINVQNTNDTRLNTLYFFGGYAKAPVLPILFSDTKSEDPSEEFLFSDLDKVEEVYETSSIYDGKTNIDPNFETMEQVIDFERFTSAGTFLLNDFSLIDVIPPNRVMDLTAIIMNHSTRIIRFAWTSPGDDMNDGIAANIDLRYHNDRVFLARAFEQCFKEFLIINGSLQPPAAYEIHSMDVQLPSEEELPFFNGSRIFYFALRAIDEAGNFGQVSNVIMVDFTIQKQILIQTYSSTRIYVLVMLIVGACMMVIIVVITCYSRKCSKKAVISESNAENINGEKCNTSKATVSVQEYITITLRPDD